MKNLSWLLPVGVIGYLLYQASVDANTVQQLSYMIYGIKYNPAMSNLVQTQLLVKLRVNNPSFNSVSFNNFSGALFIKGLNLASTSYNPGAGIVLKPGYTDIEFPVNISNLTIALQLKSIITDILAGKLNEPIRIVGALAAGGVTIPIDQTLKLTGSGLGRINGTTALKPFTPFLDY